jgi:hypothetical protein
VAKFATSTAEKIAQETGVSPRTVRKVWAYVHTSKRNVIAIIWALLFIAPCFWFASALLFVESLLEYWFYFKTKKKVSFWETV